MGFYCFNRIFVGTYLFCPGMSREVLKNKDKRCPCGRGETNRLEWDALHSRIPRCSRRKLACITGMSYSDTRALCLKPHMIRTAFLASNMLYNCVCGGHPSGLYLEIKVKTYISVRSSLP